MSSGLKIWLIARSFLTATAIGAERPKKFVRHWCGRGSVVTVFTVRGNERRRETGEMSFRVRESSELLSIRGNSKNQKGAHPRFVTTASRLVTALLGDPGWAWMASLRKDLDQASSEQGLPDVIVATGNPFFTFLTVSAFCREHDVPYILDYRDAWAYNPHLTYSNWLRRWCVSRLESKVNRDAAGILTVSKLTAKALCAIRPPLIIYNFPDDGYIAELKRHLPDVKRPLSSRLTIVFGGTLYPHRDLDPFCAGLAALEKEERGRIEFHYCGISSSRARAAFRRSGIESSLVDHGLISKGDSISLVQSCDIALSIVSDGTETDGAGLKGVITTKVFDYLVLDKEVLSFVPPGFEYSELLRTLSLSGGRQVDPNDVSAVTEYLRRALKRKAESLKRFSVSEGAAEILADEWRRQMDSLDGMISEIVR